MALLSLFPQEWLESGWMLISLQTTAMMLVCAVAVCSSGAQPQAG